MTKIGKRRIHGILLLDKMTGISSNKALQQVKYLYRAQKAGHTGSLDPLASGMLPICFGEATKYSQYLLDAAKQYYVIGQLGVKTTTGDTEGEISAVRPVPEFSAATLAAVVNRFQGEIVQIPPMYSALKHQGQPLYKLARQGVAIERTPRKVHIFTNELLNYHEQCLTLRVTCSKGTYIRTLIEDIGEALGCGAHVTVLRRLSVAHFQETQMISFATLEQQTTDNEATLDNLLLPIETLLPAFPKLELTTEQAIRLRQGQPITHTSLPEGIIKLYLHSNFIGLGKGLVNQLLPERLIVA